MLLTRIDQARRSANRRAAFTLLEVLIVVAILVILASAASIALFRYLEDAKVSRAKADMKTIEIALKTYYTQNLERPQQGQEGLASIIPLLEQGQIGLQDPWGGYYSWQLDEQQGVDGQLVQRPLVICTPAGKPQFTVPDTEK